MRDLSNHSTTALHELLTQTTIETAESFKRCCEILAELKKRGETSPMMRNSTFRFYQEITDARLSALAAFTFAGLVTILTKLVDLPLEQQDAIARGETLPVAELDRQREIVEVEKPILQMDTPTLNRVFTDGKIRPIKQQIKLLRSEMSVAAPSPVSIGRIGVDKEQNELLFGRMRVRPDELREALRELGFKLVRQPSKSDGMRSAA